MQNLGDMRSPEGENFIHPLTKYEFHMKYLNTQNSLNNSLLSYNTGNQSTIHARQLCGKRIDKKTE